MRPIDIPGKRSAIQSTVRSGAFVKGAGAGKRQLLTAAAVTACLMLTACAGGQIEELEAQLAAERVAAEEARSEAEQAARAAETARRAAEQAERERVEAMERLEREREELARAERLAREQAEQQAREAAALRAQREAAARSQQQQEQRARLASMEAELAAMQQRITGREQANVRLREAITAAEELLQMLDSEQQKYENLDDSGQTVEPLQQGLIAELEARKNALIREAEELTRQSQ